MSGSARYKNGVRVSERHGAGEWTLEKILLALLMPLGLWLVLAAYALTGSGYDGVVQWFASPLNAGLLIATALAFFGYASLAWKVIIEDYIHVPTTKALLIGLSNVIFLALAAASVFFIVRLALGSAPLPAGFAL
ncbi:MAG: succinate dehydrogenase, hydrophobic membrane anchor protein [Pseudomonadota bacterium]